MKANSHQQQYIGVIMNGMTKVTDTLVVILVEVQESHNKLLIFQQN